MSSKILKLFLTLVFVALLFSATEVDAKSKGLRITKFFRT